MQIGRVKIHFRFFIILSIFGIAITIAILYIFSQPLNRQKKVLGVSVTPTAVQKKKAEGRRNLPLNAYSPLTVPYKTEKGDTVFSIAQKYHADPQTILDYPYNNLEDNLAIIEGQTMIIPNGYLKDPDAPGAIEYPETSGTLDWPVDGKVTQYASWFHPGAVDISTGIGDKVKAAAGGKVSKVDNQPKGYGAFVVVQSEDGVQIAYGHLSKTQVVVGQTISKDDVVGLSGSSGKAVGPFLYFETKKNGEYVDPLTLLKRR
ncbi:MAG: peptidoglycan DD-metalloendopeptidase family protein [Candidatus Levyibacteriota bacterium]